MELATDLHAGEAVRKLSRLECRSLVATTCLEDVTVRNSREEARENEFLFSVPSRE